MKRYYTPDIVFGPVSEDEEVHSVYKASEVQALLRAVAEEVEKLPHATGCSGAFCSRCLTPVDRYEHWARDLDAMQHQFEPNECNCPRGKVLALLEVEK